MEIVAIPQIQPSKFPQSRVPCQLSLGRAQSDITELYGRRKTMYWAVICHIAGVDLETFGKSD